MLPQLHSFVPVRVLSGLSSHPDEPEARRLTGAVLFADISGFSRLTEELCRQGAEGVEQLASVLDPAFRRYVEIVDRHGGEVVRFVGDGLVAWWEDARTDPSAASSAAVGCALALRDDARRGTALPDLHLGVDHGPLWSARLGGTHGRWELVLGGAAVRGAARAEREAGDSEVVVGPGIEAQPFLSGQLMPRAAGCFDIARAAPPPHAATGGALVPGARDDGYLSAFVPRIVVEQTTRGGALAELRPVTSLFVRIDGLDEQDDDALGRFQTTTEALHRTARAFSSSTGQLLFDDKGLVFLLVFGAPFNTHSDDPRRAVRTAQAIQSHLGEIGLTCSVGIAGGRAFCGALGNEIHSEYATVGPSMNTAARLMQRADGSIIVTSDVAARLDNTVTITATEKIALRSGEAPVSMRRVLRGRVRGSPARALVGRRMERDRIRATLEGLVLGRGGGLLIEGDAGLGKSRLATHMTEAASALGIASATGAADAEGGAPYQALRGIFRVVFDVPADATPKEIQRRVLERLDAWPRLRELAPLLGAVLPVALPDSAVTRQLEGQSRADATLQVLVECIDNVAPKPLLVLVEDVHWMDSASRRLVERAVEQTRGVLFALTTRPLGRAEAIAPQTEAWETLRLGPLSAADVTELVSEVLGGARVASDVARAVFEQTAGNPLFAQECALLLREQGRIVLGGDCWEPSRAGRLGADLARGATVQGLVASRLDNLDARQREVLKLASIIGEHFAVALLSDLLQETTGSDVNALVTELEHRQLLSRARSAGEISFRHAVLRDVAYELMLFKDRRAGHRRIAEALEAAPGAIDPARLAHHWALSDAPARAVPHADAAASRALGTGAYREAVELLERCLELSGRSETAHDPDVIRWRRQLCDAYEGMGDNVLRDRAAKRLLELRLGASMLDRRRLTVDALAHLGARMRLVPAPLRARRLSDRERKIELDLARARRHRAAVCYFDGDSVGMMVELLGAIAHGERYGPCTDLSTAMTQFAGGLGFLGMTRISKALRAHALDVAERVGDPLAVAQAHMFSAVSGVGRGEWEDVERSTRICIELFERYSDFVNWCNTQAVRFWASYFRARPDAPTLARALLERAEQTGNEMHRIWGLRCLGTVALDLGELRVALARLDEAARRLGPSHQANEIIAARGPLALALWRSDRPADSLEAVEQTLATAEQLRRPSGHAVLAGLFAVLDVAFDPVLCREEPSRSMALQRRGLDLLSTYRRVFPVGEPGWWYYTGRGLAVRGDDSGARRAYHRGLRAVNRTGVEMHRVRLMSALAGR